MPPPKDPKKREQWIERQRVARLGKGNPNWKNGYYSGRDILYEKLFKQQSGVCAICGKEGTWCNQNGLCRLCMDHNHKTGRIRGLLCNNCNRGLGAFMDNEEFLLNAIQYLNR